MRSFHVKGIHIGGHRPVLMGILNLSPESFYSGSFVPFSSIEETAEQMVSQGADILDVGARSTAPGSTPISVAEECQRIEECLSILEGSGYCISVDTMHPEVLKTALQYDISLVNDISGLLHPEMGSLVADSDLPAILMATSKMPGDALTFNGTIENFSEVIKRAAAYDITNIILDPAIGKWIPERNPQADWELCSRFSELKEFDFPLLAAVSRKSFIGDLTGRSTDDRLAGTLAVTTSLIEKGADVVRAHDIPETLDIINTVKHLQEFS